MSTFRGVLVNAKVSYDSEWSLIPGNHIIANIFSSATTISECHTMLLFLVMIRIDWNTQIRVYEQYLLSYSMSTETRWRSMTWWVTYIVLFLVTKKWIF